MEFLQVTISPMADLPSEILVSANEIRAIGTPKKMHGRFLLVEFRWICWVSTRKRNKGKIRKVIFLAVKIDDARDI